MAEAVLFDLDGTLLDRPATLEHFLKGQYRRFADHLASVSSADFVSNAVTLDRRGHTPRHLMYEGLTRELKLSTGLSTELLADCESRFPANCFPLNGMRPTLVRLRSLGFRLGLITNGRSVTQRRAIAGLRLNEVMDTMLVSEEEGIRKPSPEIFHRALGKIGAEPGEATYVGDHPEADIRGARDAGLRAIWVSGDYWPQPDSVDGVIRELKEVPDLVRSFRSV